MSESHQTYFGRHTIFVISSGLIADISQAEATHSDSISSAPSTANLALVMGTKRWLVGFARFWAA
jgi:hypothetical protein